MENLSQKVCAQCENLEQCVTTAVNNPDLQIKCIHFGYVTQVAGNYMNRVKDEIVKIRNELIGIEE